MIPALPETVKNGNQFGDTIQEADIGRLGRAVYPARIGDTQA